MTLRDTVTRWHAAICLLDENRLDEAAHKLLEIQKPSAKIFYNLGIVCMLQCRYRDAIQYLNTSIDQDKYMAIAFYQRGLCYYEIQRFDAAKSDFLSARSMIRNNGIDYKQLGAEVLLSPQLLDHCIAVTEECLSKKTDGRLQALPVRDCVLRPPQALVDNLVKQTFLGNAKVISSAKGEDIVTGLEKRKAHDLGVKTWTSASVPSSPASVRHALSTSNAKKMFIPPPPNRPPPRLPDGATVGQQLRLKSKSLEDVTVNHVVHQSSIVEEKSKMGHIKVSPKPKPAVFNISSSVAETPSSCEDTYSSTHPHSETSGRVSTHVLDSRVVRNHVTDILSGRLNLPDKPAPSRLVVNHAQACAFTGQNEGNTQCLGPVSGGHAAQMKLLFERGGKQEEKLSQEGIRLNTQKCKLDSELQETITNSQKKTLDILQQSKSGNSQQNRTNIQQCLSSSSSSTAPGSSIQKSVKPVRPPPPKFSK